RRSGWRQRCGSRRRRACCEARMSKQIYRLLLRLYPRAFREEYGSAMEQMFADRMREEPRVRLWLSVLADCAVSVVREHRRPRTTGRQMPGFAQYVVALVVPVGGSAVLCWVGGAPAGTIAGIHLVLGALHVWVLVRAHAGMVAM